ncbi:MAG: hypothetical protein P1V51_09885 [Deltaproteobacteria bacterium]|nr:hypothetical protein [Deltaproteobacteria bacterium]
MNRQSAGDLQRCTIDRGSHRETWVSGRVLANPSADLRMLRELHDGRADGSLARLRLFGASTVEAASLLEHLPGWESDLYLSPRPGTLPFFGLQALILEPAEGSRLEARPLEGGGEAWLLDDPTGDRRLAYLFHVASSERDTLRAYEATYRRAFEELAALGFAAPEVARTWCFFRDVLEDYPGFNAVRRGCFQGLSLLGSERIPASTGIQSILASGEHLTLDALAASGSGVTLQQIENPAQCEATSYGSLFSRAIRIEGLGPPMLLISGMASIDDDEGLTLHVGDARAQLDTTLEKAAALLEAGGSAWERVVSGIVYVKPGHEALFEDPRLVRLMDEHPLAVSLADVCRDDLLVEIELLAV